MSASSRSRPSSSARRACSIAASASAVAQRPTGRRARRPGGCSPRSRRRRRRRPARRRRARCSGRHPGSVCEVVGPAVLGDHDRRLPQPAGPARVAEPAPRRDHRAGPGRGHGLGRREPADEVGPRGLDTRATWVWWSITSETSTGQRSRRRAPRQVVTAVADVPVAERAQSLPPPRAAVVAAAVVAAAPAAPGREPADSDRDRRAPARVARRRRVRGHHHAVVQGVVHGLLGPEHLEAGLVQQGDRPAPRVGPRRPGCRSPRVRSRRTP